MTLDNLEVFIDHKTQPINLRKTEDHKCDGNNSCSGCTRYGPQRLRKNLEELEIKGRIKTIQTTGLLKSALILRLVLET